MRPDSLPFLESIEKNDPTFKKCTFTNENFNSDDLSRLKIALEHNTYLEDLSFSGSRLGDSGIATLAVFLRKNISLRRLSLYGCSISDIGIESLVSNLAVNTTLTSLDLTFNSITKVGAQFITQLFATGTSLKFLALCNNGIDDDGAINLCKSIKNNNSLQELRIQYNKITSPGGEALLDLLKTSSSIRFIYTYGNSININIVKNIREINEKNEKFYNQAFKTAKGILSYTRLTLSNKFSIFHKIPSENLATIFSYAANNNSLTTMQITNIISLAKDKKNLGITKEQFLESIDISSIPKSSIK